MFTGSADTGTFKPFLPNPNIIPFHPSLHPYIPHHPSPGPLVYTPETEPHEIFACQLKWSIFEDLSNAELFSLDAEDKPKWTPLFSTPVPDEAATNPPVSRLKISIESLDGWDHWKDAGKKPPASGLIENTDGQPITVRQFLQGVQNYAISLRRILCRCFDIWSAEGEARTRFFFTSLLVHGSDSESGRPDAVATVDVEDDDDEGDNWARQLEFMELFYRKRIASK